MKNLKKVLALVVVFTMVLSSVAFASYPDVDATADYAGAVELLSALSILKGDDTGNFNPDKNITRAEFAAVVCRALGLEGSANGAKGATDFTDVAADHWASGYINLASQQNIINGMGDGTFAPESDVTYTQAVKMLVVALGYEPMAEKKGGYPAGYLATANSIGLTEGVPSTASDVAALRSTVAMLTANAMELPTMEQHTYGTESLYGVNDGKDYKFKSLLTAMDIYIATGVVQPITDDTRLTVELVPTQNSDDGKFKMTYHKEDTDNDGDVDSDDDDVIDTIEFQVNGSDIADYVNQKVNVYAEVTKSKNYIVAIVPSDEGTSTEIDASLITVAGVANNAALSSQGYVEYYQTADSTKTSKMYIKNATPVVNGVVKSDLYAELNALTGKDATVKFIENTGDKYNDVVDITVYEYYTVKAVDVAKDRIEFGGTNGKTVTFTEYLEDDAFDIKFKDAEGNDIEIADFAEGDVVAVVAEELTKCRPAANTNEVVTYYNLGESLVNGTVTSLSATDNIVYVDGTAYDVIGKTVGTSTGFKLGDEGAYFLTKTGKVFDFDGSLAKNYKVAYVLDAYYDNSGINAGTVQFQLLTADQGIVIVDANSTFTYAKADGTGVANATVKTAGSSIEAIYKAAGTATKVDRIVKYKLNSDNYLRSVEAFAAAEVGTLNSNAKYVKDLSTIGGNELVADAKVFAVDSTDATKSFVTSVSVLNEDNDYADNNRACYIAGFDSDDYTYSVVVVDRANLGGIDKAQGIAVVANVASTTYEGEEATLVNVYSDNSADLKALYFTSDDSVNAGDNTTRVGNQPTDPLKFAYTALNAGSVILYTADENGLVSSYIVLGTFDSTNKVLALSNTGITNASGTTADGITYGYVYGFIDTINDGKVKISGGNANGKSYKAAGNMYTFEYRTKAPVISVDDYTATGVDAYDNNDTDNTTSDDKANFVFMKVTSTNKVLDIYTIANRAAVTATIAPSAVETVEEVVVEEVVVDEDIVEVEIED